MKRSFRTTFLVLLSLITVAMAVGSLVVKSQAAGEASDAAAAQDTRVPDVSVQRPFVVFVGDSYSAGTGASSPSARFVTILAHRMNWAFQSVAEGGTGYDTTADTGQGACADAFCDDYSGHVREIASMRPDVVFVSGGRNDLGEPKEDLPGAVRRFYEELREALPRAQIVATSPVWDYRQTPTALVALQRYVKASVEAVGGTYLNIGEPLGGKRELVSSDGIHPNDAGYGALAEAMRLALVRSGVEIHRTTT